MKLSVCTDAVFSNIPTVESMHRLRALGITDFEFWAWWNKDIDAIDRTRRELGMQVVALCTRFISLVDQGQRAQYLGGLKETIAIADQLDCPLIISQVGNELPGTPRAIQQQSLIDALRAAVPLLAAASKTLVFEPLNTLVDHPGYYLWSSEEAFTIVDQVASDNVKVLYDIYHQQVMEGHLIHRITRNIDRIGHFHAAGNPGRHELSLGEINYEAVFAAIRGTEYKGHVGLEYSPVQEPESELRRMFAGRQLMQG